MVFSLGKILLSDKEIIPFQRYNPQWHDKIGMNGVTLQYKSCHCHMSEKPKTANLIIVIYKLMYLKFKIGKYFPQDLLII